MRIGTFGCGSVLGSRTSSVGLYTLTLSGALLTVTSALIAFAGGSPPVIAHINGKRHAIC